MARLANLVTEAELDAMKRRGWIERSREPRPCEARILVTLWHPCQTIGVGSDRQVLLTTGSSQDKAKRCTDL